MARTDLTKKTALGAYGSYTANAADLPMAAADAVNKNQFVANGSDLVIAHNTGSVSHSVTITSSPDPFRRTGDIAAYSINPGDYVVFGPFAITGWIQADGKIYLEANSAEVKFGVVAL